VQALRSAAQPSTIELLQQCDPFDANFARLSATMIEFDTLRKRLELDVAQCLTAFETSWDPSWQNTVERGRARGKEASPKSIVTGFYAELKASFSLERLGMMRSLKQRRDNIDKVLVEVSKLKETFSELKAKHGELEVAFNRAHKEQQYTPRELSEFKASLRKRMEDLGTEIDVCLGQKAELEGRVRFLVLARTQPTWLQLQPTGEQDEDVAQPTPFQFGSSGPVDEARRAQADFSQFQPQQQGLSHHHSPNHKAGSAASQAAAELVEFDFPDLYDSVDRTWEDDPDFVPQPNADQATRLMLMQSNLLLSFDLSHYDQRNLPASMASLIEDGVPDKSKHVVFGAKLKVTNELKVIKLVQGWFVDDDGCRQSTSTSSS
jgi:hypothetical protein